MVGISFKKKPDNIVFLETYSTCHYYQNAFEIKVPVETLIAYLIYKYCTTPFINVQFITRNKHLENDPTAVTLREENLIFMHPDDIPWQVGACHYPVVMCDDYIVTGLCAVTRHICKYKNCPLTSQEHEDGLLGFRHGCLQAPNEVSIWTKFCEIDVMKTVKEILSAVDIKEVPIHLVRFENHLKKPVRVHNVYKIARHMQRENFNAEEETQDEQETPSGPRENEQETGGPSETSRVPKSRKWKSKKNKALEIDCSTKIEDLNVSHEFAEGPFLTLADLVLLPSYQIIIQSIGETRFESLLPLTFKWYKNITSLPQVEKHITSKNKMNFKTLSVVDNLNVPTTDDVSLYKCDPRRHNPKKRLFTKEDDIEEALKSITEGMELTLSDNEFDTDIKWDEIPEGANPNAGYLPDERVARKSQQLANLAVAVMSVAKEGDLLVDFCSGSGHLGLLLAHLLPKSTIILLENKEQSLLRARTRAHKMGMKNVYFFQCNLDFFVGKFDVGTALHACGIASDLVLNKCLRSSAKFVICPCCYGFLHATDRMVYPRSKKFGSVTVDQYLCIGHAADQTHEEHPLAVRGARCMVVIDSDRGRYAEELHYKVKLTKLKPLTCTPKNNLLIGVPSYAKE